MDKNSFLKDLADRICQALPQNLQGVKADIDKNVRTVLSTTFNKLDLVTREEFDAQTKVLQRTRQKVEKLEAEILALEKHLKDKKR